MGCLIYKWISVDLIELSTNPNISYASWYVVAINEFKYGRTQPSFCQHSLTLTITILSYHTLTLMETVNTNWESHIFGIHASKHQLVYSLHLLKLHPFIQELSSFSCLAFGSFLTADESSIVETPHFLWVLSIVDQMNDWTKRRKSSLKTES